MGGHTSVHDIPGAPAHADLVQGKLDRFHLALAEQYRRKALETVANSLGRPPVPAFAYDRAGPAADWDGTSDPLRNHLANDCPYTVWYFDAMADPVGAINCDYSGCPMPQLMADCETWAWDDRQTVFRKIPKFADHAIGDLRFARDTLVGMAGDFGATSEGDDDPAFQTDLTLADSVDGITPDDDDEEEDWRARWTGTAADAASDGFFSTVAPTFNNHAVLANDLASLINFRATIIDTTRQNTLELLEAATVALGGHATVVDLSGHWRMLGRAGDLIGTGKSMPTKGAGAIVKVVAWLGEKYLGEISGYEYPDDPGGIVANLVDELSRLCGNLDDSESEYADRVAELRGALGRVPSFWLELYDLTENDPGGTGDKTEQFSVEVEAVLHLAQDCYEIAEDYQQVAAKLGRTYEADPSLRAENGIATAADLDVIAMRDEFAGYLRTTVARYILAADQLHDGAGAYAETDGVQGDVFDRMAEGDWVAAEVGPPAVPFDPEQAARPTDRPAEANEDLPEDVATDRRPD